MADPLLALIQEYRNQLAINNETECDDVADEEAVAEATYRPSYNRLRTDPPTATSYEGALAAIRLVADEEENCGGQPDLTVNVLRAALGLLDGAGCLLADNVGLTATRYRPVERMLVGSIVGLGIAVIWLWICVRAGR